MGTDGRRIYAIGDVHGRRDLLDLVLDRITLDLAARPHGAPHVVMLGDYVDRGPDSRGVIDRLIALAKGPVDTTFLLGNHDHFLLRYLEDPEWSDRAFHWFQEGMGGAATLASYGVTEIGYRAPSMSHSEFDQRFPAEHRHFLDGCRLSVQIGSYFFVHAGIRPGVPLDTQEDEDLLWIREPFLSSRAEHGAKVVHGHTVVPFVEHHRNRIAVDTGAVRTGTLSCVILDGEDVSLLTGAGPRPLREGAGAGLERIGRRIGGRLGRFLSSMATGRSHGSG